MDSDPNHLLKILEAHGRQFLNSFSAPILIDRKSDAGSSKNSDLNLEDEEYEEYEEWDGFRSEEESASSDNTERDDFDISDDDFTAATSTYTPNVVIFSNPQLTSTSVKEDKSQMKAFMSSKVSKLKQDTTPSSVSNKPENNDYAELTNAQNDALLHRLVHTKLLSGSLNPELNLSGAQRCRALEGRALELAGKSKLGRGESLVKQAERKKATKRVRLGLEGKQKERAKKQLEEAKNLGNYHPMLKKAYGLASDDERTRKKRERGLKMGVGKFQGGTLKLSREDINSVNGRSGSRGGKSKGKRKR